MPFGKHKDEEIEDIPSDYLRWVLKNITGLDYRLRRAIERELGDAPRWSSPPAQPVNSPPVSAFEQIIRVWHREMTMKYHPDRGGHHEAMIAVNDGAERFRELAKQIAGAA